MSNDNRRRAFKPLRLKLSAIEDPEVRTKIEMMYEEMQVSRQMAVEEARKSAIADRLRSVRQAEAEIAFIRLMQETAKHLDPVAKEPVWAAFRDKGDIVFECPFSENDQRNAMTVQRASLEAQARQLEENSGGNLYEGDADDEESQD